MTNIKQRVMMTHVNKGQPGNVGAAKQECRTGITMGMDSRNCLHFLRL